MPQLWNLTVSVASGGNALHEWGTQHSLNRALVSTFVEATTDHAFEIIIQPNPPWTGSMRDALNVNSKKRIEAAGTQQKEFALGPGEANFSQVASHLAIPSEKAPDYHLVAELYLDDAKFPARRCAVSLDSGSARHPRYGPVLMKRGWTTDTDGILQETRWVFKERGLETVLARLDVGSRAELEDEEILSDSMNKTKIDQEVEDGESTIGRAGQITVNLLKATIHSEYLDPEYSPRPMGNVDDEGGNVGKDITHKATTISSKLGGSSKQIRVVKWTPYEPDDKIFASFIFRYRSQDTLRKYGFPGFPPKMDFTKRTTRLDTSIGKITPLSASMTPPLNGSGKRLRSGKDYQIPRGKATRSEAAAKEGLKNEESCKEQDTEQPISTKRLRSGKDYEMPTQWAKKAVDGAGAGQSSSKPSKSEEESWGLLPTSQSDVQLVAPACV